MGQIKRNPAPPNGGDRYREVISCGGKIFKDHTALTPQSQLFDDGFDPVAMPIIAAHFFGLLPVEEWHE